MNTEQELREIIGEYNTVVKVVDKDAKESEDHAYGGFVREVKGKLQEHITESLIMAAWNSVGGDPEVLEINSKKISIPIKEEYLDRIEDDEVKKHIAQNIDNYIYKLSVDKHVFVNGEFVIGIECKAFTENAMIKRILLDFDLLKTQYPNLLCYLFQLESQLGGDYRKLTKPIFGSHSTRTLQSYFSCDLTIVTLLEGERDIERAIHKPGCFKELNLEVLQDTVHILAKDMRQFS